MVITDLETVALVSFKTCGDGILRAEFPNGSGIIEIRGDIVRFIPYGADESDIDTYQFVKV